MTRDPELLTVTALAATLFAAIALAFPTLLRRATRNRRVKLPHPRLVLVFRLYFAALALAALFLTLHGLTKN